MTSRAACPSLLLPILVVLSIALGFSSAHAGPGSPDHTIQHAADFGGISAALLSLGGLAALGARRGARAWVLALALLVGLFGFESAVHSVHHLGDPEGEESCAVSSASQNVSIAGGESAGFGAPIWRAESRTVADPVTRCPLQALRSDRGRSPPPLPAA